MQFLLSEDDIDKLIRYYQKNKISKSINEMVFFLQAPLEKKYNGFFKKYLKY
jgi:hypothetical protein